MAHLWRIVALAGLVFLAGCIPGVMSFVPGMPKPIHAEDYFSGPKLAIARAIEADDTVRIRRLAQGVDLMQPARQDMTLLWFAMDPTDPHYEAVETLVSLGVDPLEQFAEGIGSAFFYTLIPRKRGRKDSGYLLLKAMLDGGMLELPSVRDRHAFLFDRIITHTDGLAFLKLLVEHGADVNVRDSFLGNTPLQEAMVANDFDKIRYLFAHGADVNVHNRLGFTPGRTLKRRIDEARKASARESYEKLRDELIAHGMQWPPTPAEAVRDAMRARGEEPIVPAGRER